MQMLPLGTNGFFSSNNRQTMCFAIPHEKTLIILDAGSGLFRFAEPRGKELLAGISDVHLYLSHYHLDHTVGFYAASKFFAEKNVTVFGKSGKHVFRDMTSLEYIGKDYPAVCETWQWKQVEEKEFDHSTYSVAVRRQVHNGAGSLAYRFTFPDRTSLAYVTDSEPTPQSVAFCKDSTVLLHEHWRTGEEQHTQHPQVLEKQYESGHTTTIGAARIAREAGATQLFLVHHHPFHTDEELTRQQDLAKTIFPPTSLATDLYSISW